MLRERPGVAAFCTGAPTPSIEECRDQGEQAFEERPRPVADLARLEIDFRAGDSGCRAVTWRYIYDDGAHEDASTLVCP